MSNIKKEYQEQIEDITEFIEDNEMSYQDEYLREMLRTAFKVNKNNAVYTVYEELRDYSIEEIEEVFNLIKAIKNWEPLQKDDLEDMIDEIATGNWSLTDLAETDNEELINEVIDEAINNITAF